MFKQRKYALRKVSGIGLASCCIGVLLFLGGSPISADETSEISGDTIVFSSEVSDLKDKPSDSMSNIQESTADTNDKTNDESVEDKNIDTEPTKNNMWEKCGSFVGDLKKGTRTQLFECLENPMISGILTF